MVQQQLRVVCNSKAWYGKQGLVMVWYRKAWYGTATCPWTRAPTYSSTTHWLASHLTAVHSILLRSVHQLWSAKWSRVCILRGGIAQHRGADGEVASGGGAEQFWFIFGGGQVQGGSSGGQRWTNIVYTWRCTWTLDRCTWTYIVCTWR